MPAPSCVVGLHADDAAEFSRLQGDLLFAEEVQVKMLVAAIHGLRAPPLQMKIDMGAYDLDAAFVQPVVCAFTYTMHYSFHMHYSFWACAILCHSSHSARYS